MGTISEHDLKIVDALAQKACQPGCGCSEGYMMCDDRAQALKAGLQAIRHIQSGDNLNFSDADYMELTALVSATARLRKIEGPKARRLDIMLRNGSPRAVRLVRRWTAGKLTFEYLLDATSPRRFHGA